MITEEFKVQIDFNYINGMSPMLDVIPEEKKTQLPSREPQVERSECSSVY